MTWKAKLRQCFGLEDRRFAEHPSDLKQAYEVLGQLIEKNIGMAEVEAEIQNFLENNRKLHVDEQISRVREFYRIWLDD